MRSFHYAPATCGQMPCRRLPMTLAKQNALLPWTTLRQLRVSHVFTLGCIEGLP